MTDAASRLSSALADRYRLERELGQGGMATVYLAEDLKHDRKVALKVLRPELAAVLGAKRFVQEIKTTAALSHPHILPLFDSGTADGFLFYVMPYVEGETLRTKLDREKQLGIDEAVKITTEVADALDYAHRHGVIHRDIKPENILLHDGRPMVADFGIALAVSAAAGGRMTETGLSLGTPHYMSPEQATAEKEITARSDVYSLASVLYEMLTGTPPHVGASAQQIIMKIVTDQARSVTELRKAVPPNVAAALMKALEKLPADRFATAREFALALANPGFTTSSVAGAASAAATRRVLGLTQVAMIAILGVAVGALGSRMAARHGGTLERHQLTFEGRATKPGISPDGSTVAYERQSCEHGGFARCRSDLVVQDVGATRVTVLLRNLLWMNSPRWTADGQALVVNAALDSSRVGLFVIPLATATPRLVATGRGAYDTHAVADSVVLITPVSRTSSLLRIIDLRSGLVTDSFQIPPLGRVVSVAWSPDGQWFGVVASRGGPHGLTLLGRHGRAGGSFPDRIRRDVRWSPDGRSVLTFRSGAVREDELIRLPVGRNGSLSQAEVVLPRVSTLYQGLFDVARRTGTLALGVGDAFEDLYVVGLERSPATARRVATGTTWYGDPGLTADGAMIYVLRGDAAGDNLYRIDVATGEQEALTAQDRPGDMNVRLSADGHRLATGRGVGDSMRLEVMEIPSGRVRSAMAEVSGGTVVPLGATGLLTLRGDGAPVLADSLGGAWKPVPVPDSIGVITFDASADGRRAVFLGQAGDHPLVAVTGLSGEGMHVVATLPADEPGPAVTWGAGDTLYLSRWLDADPTPSLWRILASGGNLTRVAVLPVSCRPTSIRVSLHAHRAACTVGDFRGDIWVYRVPGVTQ
jgi:tRNA A-37 threonylcarbamoyl transferase component Bud32/dipeptidyl aminopeptidase/acylaminoacyl peptidase